MLICNGSMFDHHLFTGPFSCMRPITIDHPRSTPKATAAERRAGSAKGGSGLSLATGAEFRNAIHRHSAWVVG